MSTHLRAAILFASALSACLLSAQESSLWRISPEKINLQMGDDRALQILDDNAQELHGASWSIDNPDLAELREENGFTVLHAKAVGTVRVTATIGESTQSEEIRIWSALRPLPPGTTNWGLHSIGRDIGDLPAVPGDGPTVYTVEQTPEGSTFLRADRSDGIQVWVWELPEKTSDVELVCGDWMGGALISANRADSYTLYTVGKDGQVRWKHTFSGLRKGHAYNLDHLVHILSQSADGTTTTLAGIDEVSGELKFELALPASRETFNNVKKSGAGMICTANTTNELLRTSVSGLFVNMDGLAYLAFSQLEWTLDGGKCAPGSTLDPHSLKLTRQEKILLWQVHPDGTYRSTDVESARVEQTLLSPISVASPTKGLITDNMSGVLMPVRVSHNLLVENIDDMPDELVYRVNPEGEVLYKMPLPKYPGALHDDMVIGSNELGFAARGTVLIAFNVREGKELWQWDSKQDDIHVLAALADSSCLVQTPTEVIDVFSSIKSKVVMQGQAMLGWNGHIYRKH
jgi:outer membrane protein assembly factor BamB